MKIKATDAQSVEYKKKKKRKKTRNEIRYATGQEQFFVLNINNSILSFHDFQSLSTLFVLV